MLASLEEVGGGVLLRSTAPDLGGMARVLSGLVCPFVVLWPPELREALRRHAREIAALAERTDGVPAHTKRRSPTHVEGYTPTLDASRAGSRQAAPHLCPRLAENLRAVHQISDRTRILRLGLVATQTSPQTSRPIGGLSLTGSSIKS
jgi:hypothetical protein